MRRAPSMKKIDSGGGSGARGKMTRQSSVSTKALMG